MKSKTNKILFYAVILLAGIFAPVIFPAYTFQLAILWLMILFALTWDILIHPGQTINLLIDSSKCHAFDSQGIALHRKQATEVS